VVKSLRVKTFANLGYNTLATLLTFSMSAATSIVLARHLSADDYGIVGFATIFINFLQQFYDLGITSSTIQKENIGEREIYTAFTLKLILGLVIFLLSFLWGIIGQKVFDNPAVKGVIIALAANLIINGIGFLPTTILTRDLKFKRLTVPRIGSQVAATAVSITTVYLGFRYWSIVISALAGTIATVVITFILCPVPIKLAWDTKAAREHLKFGSNLFFAGLMIFVLFNADNFIIGTMRGAAALGFYAIAFNWGTKATNLISQAIHSILLSTFSRVQHDTQRITRGYLSILEYVSFGAIFVNVMLLSVSRELLVLVLGGGTGKWLPAVYALDILCIYGAIRAILEPIGCIVVATGRTALILRSNAIVASLQIATLYPALRYFGLVGVAMLVTTSYALQFLVYLPALRKELSLPFSAVFRSVFPAVLSGCVLAASGFALDLFMGTCWLSMFIKLSMGCSLYLVTYGLITEWKIFKDGMQIIGAVRVTA
jgi:O-antigen/teichoic acid export membrane protein